MKRFPLLSVIFAAALIAAVVLYLERMEQETPSGKASPPSMTGNTPGKEPRGKAFTPATRPAPPVRRAGQPVQTIAIIIDDIGFDLRAVEELAKIRAPLAFAILPHTPHAAEAARFLHAAGKEILLHLPMEPRSYPEESPGPGALMVGMDGDQIRRQLQTNLAAVPYVSGVNNHMGSRFMEDEMRLTAVMAELEKRGLYFIDSRTAPDSRGREAATRAGVRFAARDLFIDHLPGYAAALEKLTSPSRREGKPDRPLLMIGHPHPETIRALGDALPRLQAEGVRLISLSALWAPMETNRTAAEAGSDREKR